MEPPGREERAIRFGCGFLFGLLVFGFGGRWYALWRGGWYWGAVAFAATLCGVLATRNGDRFWQWWAELRWWWW